MANHAGDNISTLLNGGKGSFAEHVVYTAGDGPLSVAMSDLDGDGDIDLAAANLLSDELSVLLNRGGSIFASDLHGGISASLAAVGVDDVTAPTGILNR